MKNSTLKELQERYESDEYKALIDKQGFKKKCTAGTGNSPLMKGCGGRILPLYMFPLIKESPNHNHKYELDEDGLMRRNSCKDCMKAYQKEIMKERRSRVFTKQEAVEIWKGYIKKKFNYDFDRSMILLSIIFDKQDREYKFLEVEKIKSEIKKELESLTY